MKAVELAGSLEDDWRNIPITLIDPGSAVLGILIPSSFVLQTVDGLYELSESTKPDGIFAIFESSDGAFGNLGLAGKKLSGKLFCCCPDLVQIFRVDYSFVLAECFMGRVQGSRFGHHGEIGPARPARRCLSADVVKLTRRSSEERVH
jgi:hypothetical protein